MIERESTSDRAEPRASSFVASPIVELLADPRTYPHETGDIERCETHISLVFLAGDFAYKLKKPVRLGFLDYSTPELRRRYCEEEVRLNRRLAPEIYLDVVPIRETERGLHLGLGAESRGREVDTVVRMRRIPDGAMLESIIRAGAARTSHIDALVEKLVPFFRDATVVGVGGESAAIERLRRTLDENFASVEPFVGRCIEQRQLDALRSAQLSFLALRENLFRDRVRDGRVRDGHGDLRAAHVAYVPECVVIDCVEFNEAYRTVDVASDIAFLRMDLEFLGAPDLAERFVSRFVDQSGDSGLRSVIDFYSSYRAFVRGKVDCLELASRSIDGAERRMIEKRAARHFALARFYATLHGTPMLILIGGISGSGKSTLARRLGRRLGAAVLRSDEIRKELAGVAASSRSPAAPDGGIYSNESTQRTYRELASRARELLEAGITVIADATFLAADHRELLRTAARASGAEARAFVCRVDPALAIERVRRRSLDGGDVSDATAGIVRRQVELDRIAVDSDQIEIDTSEPPDRVEERALAALRGSLDLG